MGDTTIRNGTPAISMTPEEAREDMKVPATTRILTTLALIWLYKLYEPTTPRRSAFPLRWARRRR